MALSVLQVVVCLEELENEGLLMSWNLCKQPSFPLKVLPCKQKTAVRTFDTSAPAAGGYFLADAALGFTGLCVFKTPALAMQMFPRFLPDSFHESQQGTPCFACESDSGTLNAP